MLNVDTYMVEEITNLKVSLTIYDLNCDLIAISIQNKFSFQKKYTE